MTDKAEITLCLRLSTKSVPQFDALKTTAYNRK